MDTYSRNSKAKSVFQEYAELMNQEEEDEKRMGFVKIDDSQSDTDSSDTFSQEEEMEEEFDQMSLPSLSFTNPFKTVTSKRNKDWVPVRQTKSLQQQNQTQTATSSFASMITKFGNVLRDVVQDVSNTFTISSSNVAHSEPVDVVQSNATKRMERDPDSLAECRRVIKSAATKRLSRQAMQGTLQQLSTKCDIIDTPEQGELESKSTELQPTFPSGKPRSGRKTERTLSAIYATKGKAQLTDDQRAQVEAMEEALDAMLEQRPDLVITANERRVIAKRARMPLGNKGSKTGQYGKVKNKNHRLHQPRNAGQVQNSKASLHIENHAYIKFARQL